MRALVVVLAVVALVLLAWGAGEAHYQSCVARAEATTQPTVRRQQNPLLRVSPIVTNPARLRAVAGCSRLPF